MCRVNYDKENWKLIAAALREDHTAIHVINRAQVQYMMTLREDHTAIHVINRAQVHHIHYSIEIL